MIARWLDYLIAGTDDTRLSDEWLVAKMPDHDRWTQSQQQPGMARIVAGVDEMARREFWQAIEARKAQRVRKPNVAEFKRQSERSSER